MDATNGNQATAGTGNGTYGKTAAGRDKVGTKDAHAEWTGVSRSGREKGVWVYIDAETLREVLANLGLPADLDHRELEVKRDAMKVEGRGRVALSLRRRKQNGVA